MLRIEPLKDDAAASAILELVDGPRDMRFAMTARTLAKLRTEGKPLNELTQRNVDKVTRFRADGANVLEKMVKRMRKLEIGEDRARARVEALELVPGETAGQMPSEVVRKQKAALGKMPKEIARKAATMKARAGK